MTAYELAEGILAIEERIFLTKQEHKLFQNSANMLRQQADRIAQLEKQSYRQNHEGFSTIIDKTTPQTKPLSDEEIYQLWCEADNTELLPEMRMKDGSINYIITTFARAIEERHGIK